MLLTWTMVHFGSRKLLQINTTRHSTTGLSEEHPPNRTPLINMFDLGACPFAIITSWQL